MGFKAQSDAFGKGNGWTCKRDGKALEYIGIQGLGLQVFESDSKSSHGGEAAKWVIFLHWLSMACKS